ncbi:FAD/NAD(P)-binding domain-containing protein [Macrolepiota fuliginosa MF-IS2]|uniref:FAD/NAD(P)-binding domain-containing protein n=1 Tax=Macrolepiota fuliginosa MF-IS2 TaxID=1400762 RepID=A0A9P5XFK1_9AGAR|nr:FAD/NAD(P)-binding domain-containing protein [Macrolepiota fuliginosa MF-IS2]
MEIPSRKKHILIVGGGACGMSAAYALSQHPDQFNVTLYERSATVGGMATSTPISREKYGADFINDGVQGASPVFYNTYALFDRLGFKASDVDMQVSFGRDPETEFWSNVFPSQVIDKFSGDIKKFGQVLKIIKALEPLFAVISVSAMLRIFRFSKEFGDVIVFPLVALFFGTGNQTPFISSVILERVFMDPNMRLFEYSPDTFLASIPRMCAFPRLSMLYSTWKAVVEEQGQGSVRITTNREVVRVKRNSNGAEVWSRPTQGTNNSQWVVDPGKEEKEEFGELIFCCDADAALRILAGDATWLERRILGNVKYLWDVTVTHSDLSYMEKYYRTKYDPRLNSKKNEDDPERQRQYAFAEKNFQPLYFIRSVPEDKSKIEMSFDLTVYQPQVSLESHRVPHAHNPASDTSKNTPPLECHIFQTIFLDNAPESRRFWTKDDINPEEVIMEKWWKQQSHRWQHYAGTVPWMGLINGKRRTQFAGAWTVLNMHEIAIVSGFGAAYRLGASYPFRENPDCKRLFALCLATNHMMRMVRFTI